MMIELGIFSPEFGVVYGCVVHRQHGFQLTSWCGVFYPQEMEPRRFLAYYSRILNSLKIDVSRRPVDLRFAVEVRRQSWYTPFSVRPPLAEVLRHDHERLDRNANLIVWLHEIDRYLSQVEMVFDFFNNDYAGFAAGSADRFKRIPGLPSIDFGLPVQGQLF